MWWVVLVVLLVVIGVGLFLFLPAPLVVRRSRVIGKPRAEVFARIRDFRTWIEWSPWLIAEPEAKVEYSGDTTAVGGGYSWDGHIVGAGAMEHRHIEGTSRLDMDLRFTRPFQSVAQVHFAFEDVDGGTKVTWAMESKMPKMMIPMMRTMIGMDYERGLHMLGDLMETGAIPSRVAVLDIVDRPAFHWIGIERSCQMDAIAPAMEAAISELKERLSEGGLVASGPWLTFYTRWEFQAATATFICGAPLAEPASLDGTVSGSTPSHRAFHVRHTGPYTHLGNAWSVAHTHTRARKLKCPKGGPFPYEVYTTDPETTAEDEIQTDVFLTVR